MPYLETKEGTVFYTVKEGTEGAPSIVLVHGAGGSRLHWPAQLRHVSGATVYSLDLPGHGRSEGLGCTTIEQYASTVVALLDDRGIRSAGIVGHSMGGAVAQQLVLQQPDRVSQLVLVATGARLRVAPAILRLIQEDFDAVVDVITQKAWSSEADPTLKELGREALRDAGPEVVLRDFTACDRFDVMDHLDDIEVPALVIGGEADQLTPIKYSEFLHQRLPDARLVTIPRAGHMVMLERPNKVGGAVREFVVANG